jgi:hypothetical protein
MRSSFAAFALLSIATVGAPRLARSQTCRPTPENTLAASLLASLSSPDQTERRATVDATLTSCPGAIEQFLSSLMSWEFLLARHADPALDAGPSGPAWLNSYPGRGWAYRSASPQVVTVMGADYSVREHLYSSPLLLDLDRDNLPDVNGHRWQPHPGIDLTGPCAAFDIDGDGFHDIVEWPSGNDGLLVAPEPPSKVVATPLGLAWIGPVSGRDLLGTAGGWRDGFEKLIHLYDRDHDGVLAGKDLEGLYLWTDTDGDAVVDPGELRTNADLGINRIEPPTPGECAGVFYQSDLEGASLWDWWPSYFTANRVSPLAVPPTSVPLTMVPVVDRSYAGPPVAVGPASRIDSSVLAGAGMNLEAARLVAIAPDGAWIVIEDRSGDLAEIAAGRPWRLWIFDGAAFVGDVVTPRIVPLPAVDVLQFVFESPSSALIAADAGSRLLRLDLPTGMLTELSGPGAASASFRCSFFALRDHGRAFVSGSFLDPAGYAGPEMLARIDDSAAALTLEAALDLDGARALASGFGTIRGELPHSPGRQFFVTQAAGGGGTLVTTGSGAASVVGDAVAPIGLAGNGDRVLYFREAPGSSDLEVRVYDAAAATTTRLGRGAYNYPYLVAGGRVAVMASVDWPTRSMKVWAAPVVDDATFYEVLSCGVGAIRVAEDGGVLACLAPEGLYVTRRVAAGVSGPTAGATQFLSVWPNPFLSGVSLRLALTEPRRVCVDVFSIDGRRVARLLNAYRPAGVHLVAWSGRDDDDRRLPAGVYFIRVDDGKRSMEGKVALLR